jgi:UDP-N-acetylmuramate: L-alanyl-gamma-D-glutamyl-meso-diaminopimelate ligase
MPKTVHFIGIAGAGMSATAKLLRDSGVAISGSDQNAYPPISDFLSENRIPCRTPYAVENIPADVDLFVIGKNAKLVPETNVEVAAAFASGKRIASFAEVLSEHTRGKDNIVVAGSYGKSTTVALLAHCLETAANEAGPSLDPSFFIGAVPLTPSTSARNGSGHLFLLEGDEYPSSNTDPRSKFLHYRPRHLLVTPLAHDHLNVFPTPQDYVRPFLELVKLPPADGTIVVCVEGSLSPDLLSGLSRPVVTYGINGGDFRAADIRYGERTRFGVVRGGRTVAELETTQLGEHNVQNIVGACALLLSLGLMSAAQIAAAVASFRGIKRRLDRKSDRTSIPIFEGFGSSYEKAQSAIAAMMRHFPERRLIVVFEPHTFSWRNRAALKWYDDVFRGAGKVFIFEPAAQGAATHDQVSHAEIIARVRAAGCDADPISDPATAMRLLGDVLAPGDAILLLSSGDLGGLVELVPALAEERFPRDRAAAEQ